MYLIVAKFLDFILKGYLSSTCLMRPQHVKDGIEEEYPGFCCNSTRRPSVTSVFLHFYFISR
jgi:hypothetical protein